MGLIQQKAGGEVKSDSQFVIIGSGVTGLSTAYSLVNRGCNDIVILDGGHLASGASSRNGGGIRAQFLTEENILLAKWSIERFRKLSRELNVNFWFRQGGYLFVAETEDELEVLKRATELQNRFGLGTKILGCDEVQSLVPEMVCASVLGGFYRRGDGVLFPFPLLFGYAEFLRSRGVSIETRCEVTSISLTGGRLEIGTSRGTIRGDKVLNAAGGWSSDVGKMMGVEIPTTPVRHQIMASEPLAPFLDPMVVTLKDGFYMSQGPRGELIGGISEPGMQARDFKRSGFEFCQLMSARIVSLFPRLASASMLRQWAGFYDMSPDANPILAQVPGSENAFVACGFSGHGFMISPAVGEIMAALMLGERPVFPAEPYRLSRFKQGSIRQEQLVIG
jgi:sarcosine oxidase subunit beta